MALNFTDAAKAKKLKEFFQKHGRIYIIVDATGDDVIVPDFLKGDPALRLVLNLRMPQPIYIREDALESDFSFSGQVYTCHIPMKRIWSAYLPEGDMEHGIVWEEDVPETIRAVVNAVRKLQEDEEPAATEAEDMDIGDQEDVAAEGRKVRHLRVVK